MRLRARDLGIPFDGTPGAHNAITDVAGIEVGFSTLVVRGGADRGDGDPPTWQGGPRRAHSAKALLVPPATA